MAKLGFESPATTNLFHRNHDPCQFFVREKQQTTNSLWRDDWTKRNCLLWINR